jgi:hypothetical protein
VERALALDRGAVQNPLVVGVVVDPHEVQITGVAAELGPELAREQVPTLELGQAVPAGGGEVLRPLRIGLDVDDRVGVEDAGAWVDAPDRVARSRGRSRRG